MITFGRMGRRGHHPTSEALFYEKSLHQNGIGSNDISIVEQGFGPCYVKHTFS